MGDGGLGATRGVCEENSPSERRSFAGPSFSENRFVRRGVGGDECFGSRGLIGRETGCVEFSKCYFSARAE